MCSVSFNNNLLDLENTFWFYQTLMTFIIARELIDLLNVQIKKKIIPLRHLSIESCVKFSLVLNLALIELVTTRELASCHQSPFF